MEPNHQNSHNRALSVSVPGKALLFGEYGVMQGGEAVVVMLPSFRMSMNFSFTSPVSEPIHRFVSRYLPNPLELPQHVFDKILSEVSDNELRRFACYLSGFREFLSRHQISAEVVSSFSPTLGFGSSSALLSCFQIALAEKFFFRTGHSQLEIERYWLRLYDALIRLQGRGSGYDVAVQTWTALNFPEQSRPRLLRFSNKGQTQSEHSMAFEPDISEVPIDSQQMKLLGCFVETGIRSDTRSVLKGELQKKRPAGFFHVQSELARQFVSEPSAAVAAQLCRLASEWSRRAELLPESREIEDFVSECDKANIPWKTMGAGHGDCLWVMARREAIETIMRNISATRMEVRHAFEEEQ